MLPGASGPPQLWIQKGPFREKPGQALVVSQIHQEASLQIKPHGRICTGTQPAPGSMVWDSVQVCGCQASGTQQKGPAWWPWGQAGGSESEKEVMTWCPGAESCRQWWRSPSSLGGCGVQPREAARMRSALPEAEGPGLEGGPAALCARASAPACSSALVRRCQRLVGQR